jgi:hypothetical protein
MSMCVTQPFVLSMLTDKLSDDGGGARHNRTSATHGQRSVRYRSTVDMAIGCLRSVDPDAEEFKWK